MDETVAQIEWTGRLGSFFAGLKPVLEIAGAAQARLDRHAATAFSVFAYFRDDELALSCVIGDLLDPKGSHGQGDLFLQAFLEPLDIAARPVEMSACRVYLEHSIAGRRRIDILLDFPGDPRCLIGIENKPWTGDQEDQLGDYIAHVDARTKNWAMLYLSGHGSGPSKHSIKKDDLAKHQKEKRFRTVPFRSEGAEGSQSIESWIERCLHLCEAERVRWFLKDFLAYVRGNFSVPEDSSGKEKIP